MFIIRPPRHSRLCVLHGIVSGLRCCDAAWFVDWRSDRFACVSLLQPWLAVLVGASMLTACGSGSRDSQVTPPPVNQAPTVSAVRIVDANGVDTNGGETGVGDVLSGDYRYADADGDAEGASTFRWLRDGAPIAGATNQAYTLTTADIECSIAFEVTPVAQTGVRQGPAVQSLPVTPLFNRAPTVSAVRIVDMNGGEADVGDMLSGEYRYADADGDAEGASTFRWLRNGAPIAGATNQVYTLTTADMGQSIAFEVTPVDVFGALGDAVRAVFEVLPAPAAAGSRHTPSSVC